MTEVVEFDDLCAKVWPEEAERLRLARISDDVRRSRIAWLSSLAYDNQRVHRIAAKMATVKVNQ